MRINTAQDLAAAVRGRRLALNLSQIELATRAEVSREWVNKFEAGKPTVEFGLVLRILDILGLSLTLEDRDSGGDVTGARAVDLDAHLERYEDR